MNYITIKIYKAESEDGYFYDIYNTEEVDENTESIDGGLCTTTIDNTLEMAYVQTKNLLTNKK
jgi:hypothetical protein